MAIEASIETVTPEMARGYLVRRAAVQRRTLPVKVRKFAEEMRAGLWHTHGQPIQFDQRGDLIDGQNRLEAVVLSGVTTVFCVVRGVPTESFAYVDIGTRRTAAQFLDGKGRGEISNAAEWLIVYEKTGGTFTNWSSIRNSITIEETVDWVGKHPYVQDRLADVNRVYKACRLHRGVHLALLTLVHEVVEADVDEWVRGLETGSGLEAGDSRLSLRDRWMRESRVLNLGGKQGGVLIRWVYVVKAWNAYMTGRSIRHIRYASGELVPVPIGI